MVVWHPLWPIRHPLVEEGRGFQLWPHPSELDLATLPVVDPREFQFFVGGTSLSFKDENDLRVVARTPLQIGIDLAEHMLPAQD